MGQRMHGSESSGGASHSHGGIEARPHTACVTGLLTALLPGASAATHDSLLADKTVYGALAAVEKSLVDLATAVQRAKDAQAQQPTLKRARTSVASHDTPSESHLHARSGVSAFATRLSLDAIRHILSYVDTTRPSALTTAACVCKAWRDATMHTDSLWTPVAHALLPFTTQAANTTMQELLRTVGGYRALVLKYARALAPTVVQTAATPETTRRYRTMVADWSKEPFQVIVKLHDPHMWLCANNHRIPDFHHRGGQWQVIFELHDRLGGGILMSQVAEARFISPHDHDADRPGPSLQVTHAAAVHQRKPFRVNDLMLPWEEGGGMNDFFTQRLRFMARCFVVSTRTGRLSLLHSTNLREAFYDQDADYDDMWSYCSPSTTLSCAAAVGTDLEGSITFNVGEQGGRYQVRSATYLEFHTQGIAISAAIADVLYALLFE